MDRLGVIIPFRNRDEHLSKLLPELKNTLSDQGIDYRIFIIDQSDDKEFNRGKLLNVGYEYAKKHECTYLVFHDVDMIPVEVDYTNNSDGFPIHIANNLKDEDGNSIEIYDTYFGGVTLFPIEQFEIINGYSNEYWGWGFEDDDLLHRCIKFELPLFKSFKNQKIRNTLAVQLNGYDSYIRIPMDFSVKDYTIFISFKPNPLECNEKRKSDIYKVFTIPGYDTSISYDSFLNYKFETWTTRKNPVVVSTDKQLPRYTTIAVSVDQLNQTVKMFQDGKKVSEGRIGGKLMSYGSEKNMYIGKANNVPDYHRSFGGLVDYFGFYYHGLMESELREITKDTDHGLLENFGRYKSAHSLAVCYDMRSSTYDKVIDLSGNGRDGVIYHCDRVVNTDREEFSIYRPHRRYSELKLLHHEPNGYYKGEWVSESTRKNQVRFHNEVVTDKVDFNSDGLTSLEYNEIDIDTIEEYIFKIKVEL